MLREIIREVSAAELHALMFGFSVVCSQNILSASHWDISWTVILYSVQSNCNVLLKL